MPLADRRGLPGPRRRNGGGRAACATAIEFTTRSLRMWAAPSRCSGSAPARYVRCSPSSSRGTACGAPGFRRENAHNNFLQIAAELGAVGIAAFLALLAACAGSACGGRCAARDGPDPLLAGAGAGAGAFVLTCLAGHPLLTSETAYPFWIVLALAVARARQMVPVRRTRREASRSPAGPASCSCSSPCRSEPTPPCAG